MWQKNENPQEGCQKRYKLAWAPHLELSKSFKGFSPPFSQQGYLLVPQGLLFTLSISLSSWPGCPGQGASAELLPNTVRPSSQLRTQHPLRSFPTSKPHRVLCASTITSPVSPYLHMSHVRVGKVLFAAVSSRGLKIASLKGSELSVLIQNLLQGCLQRRVLGSLMHKTVTNKICS